MADRERLRDLWDWPKGLKHIHSALHPTTPPPTLFPTQAELVQSRKWDVASIVSHEVSLDEAVAAYAMFDRKEDGCTKAVIRF